MIEVKKVKTRKQKKDFLNFPLELFKGNDCFVPPLYSDEKKIFSKNFVYNDSCDSIFFNAYKDGKIVGRISGIIQKASNEKNSEKRCRFTRFDSINSQEVADMLFAAVEEWAEDNGMDTVCGPLGYSDLEREGLLIEGFDQLSTFEEQYNSDYYQRLIENNGYTKEIDWIESKLRAPEIYDADLKKMSEYVLKRYNLHIGKEKNVNRFLDKYADKFFELLDVAYENLYGTVPFTDGMKNMMISNFKLIIDLKFVTVILDEKERLVCLGLAFPSIARAVQPSKGKLTPAAIIRILKAIKKPEILDLGLVAVAPDYINRGLPAVIASGLMDMLKEDGIKYAETNLNIEDNYSILNLWKRFDATQHKRRRSYVKKLVKSDENCN